MKNNTYRFTSDVEPTDKELKLLMDEFTKEVKNHAALADLKFKALQKEYSIEIGKRQKSKELEAC
jgi:hypothetical protein